MLAADSSTPVSFSLKLGTFIMINVLKALDEILRWDHRFSNFY